MYYLHNTLRGRSRVRKMQFLAFLIKNCATIELNGALYSSARQDFSHTAGLS